MRQTQASVTVVLLGYMFMTLGEHSGYHLPFWFSGESHDWHHLKFNENFGTFGILDSLHGTSKNFEKSVNFLRHKTLFSFKSLRELIPDKHDENENLIKDK
jgi:fatty acid hydroxylase domain-containing protein 2